VLRTDPAIVIRTKELDVISNGSVRSAQRSDPIQLQDRRPRGFGFSAGELLIRT